MGGRLPGDSEVSCNSVCLPSAHWTHVAWFLLLCCTWIGAWSCPHLGTATVMSCRYLIWTDFSQLSRHQRAPKNAVNRPFPESAFSGVLHFWVCFGAPLEQNKEHPKTQHTRKRRFWERSITCIFGRVAFSGALYSPVRKTGGPSFRYIVFLARFARRSPRTIRIRIWIAFVSRDSGHEGGNVKEVMPNRSGSDKVVIRKWGLFTGGISVSRLESLENGQIILCFPDSGLSGISDFCRISTTCMF